MPSVLVMASVFGLHVMTVVPPVARMSGLGLFHHALVRLMTEGRPISLGGGRPLGRWRPMVIVVTVLMVHEHPYRSRVHIRRFNGIAYGYARCALLECSAPHRRLRKLGAVDWEQALISDPRSDIAQLVALSHLRGGAPYGPPSENPFVQLYEAATGERLDSMELFRARWLFQLGVVYHGWKAYGTEPWFFWA